MKYVSKFCGQLKSELLCYQEVYLKPTTYLLRDAVEL